MKKRPTDKSQSSAHEPRKFTAIQRNATACAGGAVVKPNANVTGLAPAQETTK
jgi:hypothetical protein